MLDKEIVRFSRNGVQIDNLSTGDTHAGTVNEYGKEARYAPDEQSNYKFSRTVSTETVRMSRKNVFLSDELPRSQTTSASNFSHSSCSCRFSNVRLEDTSDMPSASPLNPLSNISAAVVSNLSSSGDESENVAIDAIKGTTNFTRGGFRIAKKIKKRFFNTKAVYNTARTTKAAVDTAKTAQTTVSLINKVLSNPTSLKVFGIVALVVLGLVLLQMMTSGITTSIVGGANEDAASTELKEYILNLDKNFISEVENKADELREDNNNSFVSITGLESVATLPADMQILLLVFNDSDITLTGSSKALLDKFHATLNKYTVEPHDREESDEDGNIYIQHGIMIYVSAHAAKEEIMSFNPTDEQIKMLEALFEMKHNSGIKGDVGWPIQEFRYISSNYGSRIDPITGQAGEFHTAIDIPMPMQTPLLAGCDGTIIFVGERGTYGNLIKLQRADGMELWYAHCDEFIAKIGNKVKLGEVIGLSGNSGRSTGPHLHFEVRINGQHQDPLKYLK